MEEEFKPTLCMICLTVKRDEDCTVIDESIKNALYTILLKLSVEEGEADKSMICNDCYTKVFEAFRFKTACRSTEESIIRNVSTKNGAPVDLKEIYLKERGEQHLQAALKDPRICRLCMQVVTCEFTFLKEVEMDLIRTFILEVNFNFTEEPVVCTGCLDSLKRHSNFLSTCSGAKKFENVYKKEETQSQFHITSEEVQIKSEESQMNSETPPRQPVVRKFRCDGCSYETNHKGSLNIHQLRHKDPAELQMYTCDKCDYKSHRKSSIKRHQIVHKDISELEKHQLTHKDDLEPPIYKCHTCGFVTKHKGSLKQHCLLHKDASRVRWYSCGQCEFKSKHEKSLKTHSLLHQDVSKMQMYDCDKCSYKAKRKADLKLHQSRHKDGSEVRMYVCEKCGFQTKRKGILAWHELQHKDPS